MIRAINFILLSLVPIFLIACAASGPKFTDLQAQMISRDQETGRIYFYRTTVLGAALRPDVLLNGQKVGTSIAKGFFYVDAPPGEYTAVTSTEVTRKVSFTLEKGQIRYIRFAVRMGFFAGHVYGELVDEQTALSEIKDCRYTGDLSTTQEMKEHADN
jgi:hypothetical protein